MYDDTCHISVRIRVRMWLSWVRKLSWVRVKVKVRLSWLLWLRFMVRGTVVF